MVPHPTKNEISHFGCARLEIRPDMASKYLKWPRIHVDPNGRFQWFYHQNQTPDLTKFSTGPPIYVWEWFIASPVEGGFQTDELLVKIASLRENQVTAASVVRN